MPRPVRFRTTFSRWRRGTTEVSGNTAGVNQAVEATGAAAGQVLLAADELTNRAGQLGTDVNGFFARIRAGSG